MQWTRGFRTREGAMMKGLLRFAKKDVHCGRTVLYGQPAAGEYFAVTYGPLAASQACPRLSQSSHVVETLFAKIVSPSSPEGTLGRRRQAPPPNKSVENLWANKSAQPFFLREAVVRVCLVEALRACRTSLTYSWLPRDSYKF